MTDCVGLQPDLLLIERGRFEPLHNAFHSLPDRNLGS